MTFFPWRGIQRGRIGAGQSTSTRLLGARRGSTWLVGRPLRLRRALEARITSTSFDRGAPGSMARTPRPADRARATHERRTRAIPGIRRGACPPSTRGEKKKSAASTRCVLTGARRRAGRLALNDERTSGWRDVVEREGPRTRLAARLRVGPARLRRTCMPRTSCSPGSRPGRQPCNHNCLPRGPTRRRSSV